MRSWPLAICNPSPCLNGRPSSHQACLVHKRPHPTTPLNPPTQPLPSAFAFKAWRELVRISAVGKFSWENQPMPHLKAVIIYERRNDTTRSMTEVLPGDSDWKGHLLGLQQSASQDVLSGVEVFGVVDGGPNPIYGLDSSQFVERRMFGRLGIRYVYGSTLYRGPKAL